MDDNNEDSTSQSKDYMMDESVQSHFTDSGLERPEHSESGMVTEMEHNRSRSLSDMDMPANLSASDDFGATAGGTKKPKSRRLSKRVAHTIKKQFKTSTTSAPDKEKLSIRSGEISERSVSDSEYCDEDYTGIPDAAISASSSGEGKKKSKSGLKPVAKAAAKAAVKASKKIVKSATGSSSSTDKDKEKLSSSSANRDRLQSDGSTIDQQSVNSSRASTPTGHLYGFSPPNSSGNLSGTHPAAASVSGMTGAPSIPTFGAAATGNTTTLSGKTPMNTPIHVTKVTDHTIPEKVMVALAECANEDTAEDDVVPAAAGAAIAATTVETVAKGEVTVTTTTTTAAAMFNDASDGSFAVPSLTEEPKSETVVVAAAPVASEDEMLRMAEAMAMAVQRNPNKSHEEIRRMVLSQPEFQHLAPPSIQAPSGVGAGTGDDKGTGGSSSSSTSTKKLLTKNFKSLHTTFTKGAGTAQKKFLEYGSAFSESTLGASVSSFIIAPVGESATATKAAVNTAAVATTAAATKAATTTSNMAHAAAAVPAAAAATVYKSAHPPTIPEEKSQAMLDSSVSTAASLQASNASLQTSTEKLLSVDDVKSAATEKVAQPQPPAQVAPPQAPAVAPGSAVSFAPTTITSKAPLPIKMTEILWKRRSGFGKFSTSSAWERRRFVLQGNVLSYYRAKGEGGAHDMGDETERFDDGDRMTSERSAGGSASGGMDVSKGSSKSTKQKMFSALDRALDQAAKDWGLSAVAPTTISSEKVPDTSARGSMDLVKENATICATLGHSGAPSPFCLSIKVDGATKWKLCFSSHRSQLQWLAAMTDTVVQASVDTYNVQLLTAADPANQDTVTAALMSHVYEPPSSEDDLMPQPSMHASGRRLWMMEPYVIRSQTEVPAGKQNDDDCSTGSAEYEEDEDMEDATAGAASPLTVAVPEDRDMWSLPEKNLTYAAAIINAAILYVRNSAMPVHGFWAAVTVANMMLYNLLERLPRPIFQNTAAPLGKVSPKKRKRKKAKAAVAGGAASDKAAGDLGKKDKQEKYIPHAGTTTVKVNDASEPMVNAKGEKFAGWVAVPGEDLQVRSHGYMTTKAKVGSPGTLYEMAQMDIFESPSRYPDMAPRVKLPKLSYTIDPNEQKTWKSPDHFIVTLALPTDPPKLGASTSDGGGYTVTLYFTLRKTTRDILKRVTADGYNPANEVLPADIQKYQVNAVRLFEEWCRRAPNDKVFQTRFKMIPTVVNSKEIGLPSWIGKYNGKPLLIKRPGQTGFLLPHPEISCVEFDISLHVFPYLAKQGICYLKDSMFDKIVANIGFVIEGRDDDELPEVVIGLAQICNPDPKVVMQASDFFAGKSRRSFDPEEENPATAAPAAPSAPTKPAAPANAPVVEFTA